MPPAARRASRCRARRRGGNCEGVGREGVQALSTIACRLVSSTSWAELRPPGPLAMMAAAKRRESAAVREGTMFWQTIAMLVIAYLCGSIPSGFLIIKAVTGNDIRQY